MSEPKSIHEAFDKAREAMNIINHAQQQMWNLHHKVKQYDEPLAMKIWEQSLQIEHALLVLNEEIFAGKGHWENET